VVAGDSYGQGSSREHAAICPSFLGVKAVVAKAIERIHKANLVNFGILPLIFIDPADYDKIQQGDTFSVANLHGTLSDGKVLEVKDETQGFTFKVKVDVTDRQALILKDGGLLNHIARQSK
jgi:aconitate hydratase